MPKALRSPADPPPSISQDTKHTAGRPRVLLADDHMLIRAASRLVLEEMGAVVSEADDGEQAVTLFADHHFDLVVMDVQMPVMDGLNAVRAIRYLEEEAKWPPTPILMLTACTGPAHEAASMAAGADLHLCKPVTPRALVSAVRQMLSAAQEL